MNKSSPKNMFTYSEYLHWLFNLEDKIINKYNLIYSQLKNSNYSYCNTIIVVCEKNITFNYRLCDIPTEKFINKMIPIHYQHYIGSIICANFKQLKKDIAKKYISSQLKEIQDINI